MRGNPTTVRRKYIEQNRYFTTGSRFDVVGTSFATTDPKSNTSTTTFSSADYYAFPQFVTNALGHQTEYAWWQHVISDLDGTVYYLRNGDLQSVRDPNGVLVSQLWYSDALGRRTQETTPAETRNFSYDDLNYLTTQASGSGYQYAETNPVGANPGVRQAPFQRPSAQAPVGVSQLIATTLWGGSRAWLSLQWALPRTSTPGTRQR